MSDDNKSNGKSSGSEAWIGAVGVLLAVLAFFGIKNYEDLARELDAETYDLEACEKYSEANLEVVGSTIDFFLDPEKGPESRAAHANDFDRFADKLDEAAAHAASDQLSQALSDYADNQRDVAGMTRSGEYIRHVDRAENDSRNDLIAICNPLFAGEE
ncbi:hypothetical protein [Nocardiopsis rhodophaea]|uniref:hypothetical protein n=1 Tax=Nocardiopsis rhodophaea TaxID=280238 RepID=UPI0031D66148